MSPERKKEWREREKKKKSGEKEERRRAREKTGHKSSLQTCGTTIERGCEEKFSE